MGESEHYNRVRVIHFSHTQSEGINYDFCFVQLSQSNKVVVFTGAGISTSCGIPDFRGPSGIWTLQRAHKPIPEFKVSFGVAKPSLTHQVHLRRQTQLCSPHYPVSTAICTLINQCIHFFPEPSAAQVLTT